MFKNYLKVAFRNILRYKTYSIINIIGLSVGIAVSIFVSCLGLLSLTAFIAEQRTKEISVRKVLGASVRHIIFSLSKEFLLLLLIANIIAWPLMYYFMKQWLDGFAYHTDMNITSFLFSSVLVSAMAIFTVSFQALKAAQANPVESLKYE